MFVGIITYDCPHLKTEQIVLNLSRSSEIEQIRLYALPFSPRPERDVLIRHRPDQMKAVATRDLADLEKVTWQRWDGSSLIGGTENVFLITGSGLIEPSKIKGARILNSHPGLIPLQRGLDAFKWAIFDGNPLGNTLHYINAEVDKGEIVSMLETPVFTSDDIESLARRHYESEIYLLSNFDKFLKAPRPQQSYPEGVARKRMSFGDEGRMVRNFEEWKKKYALHKHLRNLPLQLADAVH